MISTNRIGKTGHNNADVGMGYFYRLYVKQQDAATITQKQFTSIWKEYSNLIMEKVIREKYDLKMQAQLGSIYIVSKKIEFKFDDNGDLIRKGFRIDWKATRDMWEGDPKTQENKQVIYHFNEHSSRRNFRFYWDKRLCRALHQTFYMFYPCRKWKRELAKWIKSDDFDTIYYEAI
jgi:hypothetical protein